MSKKFKLNLENVKNLNKYILGCHEKKNSKMTINQHQGYKNL